MMSVSLRTGRTGTEHGSLHLLLPAHVPIAYLTVFPKGVFSTVLNNQDDNTLSQNKKK